MFRPQLFPNEQVDPKDMKYPLIASYKLDGIRCILKDGEMLSRSLKQIPNIQLHKKFERYKELSKTGVILDGEIYSPKHSFQEITSVVMSDDKEVPKQIDFYCFDYIQDKDQIYSDRYNQLLYMGIKRPEFKIVHSAKDCEKMFEAALKKGFEGLILVSPSASYKEGRHSAKSGMAYKYKPYRTFDAQITGVEQSTVVRDGAESKINELGYKRTSMKKDDRVLIEKASAFQVKYGELFLKVTIAMNDSEKEEVWKNRQGYIGRWIEYKGMLVGSKDVPRHPVFVRFRDDKS